jgi:Fe-S cluster assembly protein SufD
MATLINLNKEKKEHMVFDKKGQYVVFLHNLSGTFTVDLQESGIEVDIFGVFTGRNSDVFKIETIQKHVAPGSTSNLHIKGVFDDESKFDYQGLIRIEKTGQQSHAYQKNQNLILSPKVFVESKPYLEILANDVFCTHGSTTGKMNKDELYYIQTRGINEKDAKQLVIQGFIDDVLNKVREKIPDFDYHIPLN